MSNHQENNQQNIKSSIIRLAKKLEKNENLSDILKEENFAPKGKYADAIACELIIKINKPKLNISQLRKIFSELKLILDDLIKNGKGKEKLYLIYPKLAYSVGRELMPKEFYELLTACLDILKNKDPQEDKKEFEIFLNFITSIVAYAKYYDSLKNKKNINCPNPDLEEVNQNVK